MGISFGTTNAYDAFKYSSRWSLGQFESACTINCSQKQRRRADFAVRLWVVTDQTQWRLLPSAEDCWADGRVTPGARQCRGGCPATTGTTPQLDWEVSAFCSFAAQTVQPIDFGALSWALSEILHYTACPNPSLPQIRGSWLCKYNHCNSAAQEWNMFFRDRILQVAVKSGRV